MPAGDITRVAPCVSGNEWRMTGTVQVDNTYRAFAIASSSSYIKSFQLQDSSGAGSAEVDLNKNAAGTDVNGTVSIAGNHSTTNTYNYTCTFV